MAKNVVVTQDPENEVPTEVLATAIIAIAEGVKKIRAGRLNDAALTLLIREASPTVGRQYGRVKLSIGHVRAVLDGMAALESSYIRKVPK